MGGVVQSFPRRLVFFEAGATTEACGKKMHEPRNCACE
jgi:hypothetical protein